LGGGLNVALMAFDGALKRVAKIAQQMPTVRNLLGLRSPGRGSANEFVASIATDNLYFRILLQPGTGIPHEKWTRS
jgi:hypothetical protein